MCACVCVRARGVCVPVRVCVRVRVCAAARARGPRAWKNVRAQCVHAMHSVRAALRRVYGRVCVCVRACHGRASPRLYEQVPPHSSSPQQPRQLQHPQRLHHPRDRRLPADTVGRKAAAAAAAARGRDEAPLHPAVGHGGDRVEEQAAWGRDVDAGDGGGAVDVDPARPDDADEEAVEDVEDEEGVGGHVEGEDGAGALVAEAVAAPEGELEGDDEHGADEERDGGGLEGGVERGGGVDDAGALHAVVALLLLDPEDGAEHVLP